MKLPIFVISLARATERRRRMLEHLDAGGFTYRVVDAVDGRAIADAERSALLAPGINLHAGAIGCYLSHVEVYRSMEREKIPVALVLEDDARLSAAVARLQSTGCESLDFDYCFLDSDDHNDRVNVYYDRDDGVPIAPGVQAFRLSEGPQTLHAYMITLEGARKRLAHAFPIRKPIDLYDHLPYAIAFRAIVSPKMAWVSEDSLTSFTSARSVDVSSLTLAWLRRSPAFYRARDLLRLKGVRRRLEVRSLVRRGLLPAGKRWLPLPSGREVVL